MAYDVRIEMVTVVEKCLTIKSFSLKLGMVGASLEQNGCLMQGRRILWKDWIFLFHISCWFSASIYTHGSGLDCDSHQGMINVEGLLTSLVIAGVLRSGVALVGSEVPCHPYHWLISFGVQLVTNKISCWWGFSSFKFRTSLLCQLMSI